MQRANILVHLAGDAGNKVPMAAVPPYEVAVLQALHGTDAVSEIDILPSLGKREPAVNMREERQRLLQTYPARDSDNVQFVTKVFPAGAPLPTKFADLDLADSQYAAVARKTPELMESTDAQLAMEPEAAFQAERDTGRKAEDHEDYVEAQRTGDYEVEADAADLTDLGEPLKGKELKDVVAQQAGQNAASGAGRPVPPIGTPSETPRAPRLGGHKAATKAEKQAGASGAKPKNDFIDG